MANILTDNWYLYPSPHPDPLVTDTIKKKWLTAGAAVVVTIPSCIIMCCVVSVSMVTLGICHR